MTVCLLPRFVYKFGRKELKGGNPKSIFIDIKMDFDVKKFVKDAGTAFNRVVQVSVDGFRLCGLKVEQFRKLKVIVMGENAPDTTCKPNFYLEIREASDTEKHGQIDLQRRQDITKRRSTIGVNAWLG